MSKFNKPKAAGPVSQEDIDRVIGGADAVDGRKESQPAAEPEGAEVRFTMTLGADMAARIDRARKASGGLTRLAWLRVAAAEKLSRDGV
jgi:hypothetical protein